MADYENPDSFGLDNWSLCLVNDGSSSGHIKTTPSNTSDEPQFDSSHWEFPDTVSSTFDASSSASAVTLNNSTSAWDSPPWGLQQPCLLGFDNSSPANADASVLFGGPIVPSQQQTKLRHPVSRSSSRQPVTTLTAAAQEQLRNTDLPSHPQYQSPNSASSPELLAHGNETASRLPLDKSKSSNRNSRKRKASEDDEDEEKIEHGEPVKKTFHSIIEKRYRNNLNDKIAALKDAVPSLRIMSKSSDGEDAAGNQQELNCLTPAHKINKATVLSKATEYINHLEKRVNRLQEEDSNLRARIPAFEKLFMTGAMHGSITPMQHPLTPMDYTTMNLQQQEPEFSEFPHHMMQGGSATPAG